MSLLDGGGAAILGSIFAGVYLPATVYRQESVYDAYGELTTTETEYDCRAQVDSVTERQRQDYGAASKDRRILVLSTSISVAITTDCEVTVTAGPYSGVRFLCEVTGSDPCGAYVEMLGRQAS